MFAFLRDYFRQPLFGGKPRSPKWDRVRAEHLRQHPTCAACGGKEALQVHHIKPYHLFPELELEPSNLLTLCTGRKSCNCHLTFGHLGDWLLFNSLVAYDAKTHFNRIANEKILQAERLKNESR